MNTMNLFASMKVFSNICDTLGIRDNVPAWPDNFGTGIRTWLKANNIPPIRTLSLFSGAGGLDIGFSDVGFNIVQAVEIEKKFCETLDKNSGTGKIFENSRVSCVDIRNFSSEGLGKIDFVIGGPPCQTFSAAGRRANGVLGTTDARGVLFREYVRLLKELSPVGFLFENVYGITGAQGGAAWREILDDFSTVGYKLFYRILDAADYGVPQHRERLLIVGLKENTFCFPRPTHGPDSLDANPFYDAGTAIAGVKSKESLQDTLLGGRYAPLLPAIPPGLNYSFYTEEMGHPTPLFAWRSKFSDFLYKADPNEPVRTIKACGGAYTGPLHWENRFFTCEEYKRLQTFPDTYKISGKKQTAIKQIGNSVPPQLARMMAIAIRMQVFGTKFPFELPLLAENDQLSFRKRKRELSSIYREKAACAIKELKKTNKQLIQSHIHYYCSIDKSFNFKPADIKNANFKVSINWAKVLSITIDDAIPTTKGTIIEIEISPQKKTWRLEAEKVILRINSEVSLAYTAAWKAFEKELASKSIKADLVQLNGYYQYESNLIFKCKHYPTTHRGVVIKNILEHRGIPTILTTRQLAEKWGVQEDEIYEIADYLKRVGYEIRNHNTNPQIDAGCWLIPYAFPTLSPLSVQLWKTLK